MNRTPSTCVRWHILMSTEEAYIAYYAQNVCDEVEPSTILSSQTKCEIIRCHRWVDSHTPSPPVVLCTQCSVSNAQCSHSRSYIVSYTASPSDWKKWSLSGAALHLTCDVVLLHGMHKCDYDDKTATRCTHSFAHCMMRCLTQPVVDGNVRSFYKRQSDRLRALDVRTIWLPGAR